MPNDAFDRLIETFLTEFLDDHPLMATGIGLFEGYADRLGDYSADAIRAQEAKGAAWIERFTAVDLATLDFEQAIDRDLAIATLTGDAILADWEMWRRQPADYLGPGLGGVFNLFLHRLRPEAEIVHAAAARLRAVPQVLADGKANLDPDLMPPIYVERAIGQARAGAGYARSTVATETDDPELKRELSEAGALAADAFDDFAGWLSEVQPRARGEFAIGEARYSRLLQEAELLGFDTRALHQRGWEQYERYSDLLTQSAQAIAGTDDWPAVITKLQEDHPATPEAMREAYAEWTEKARRFLADNALVSFPAGEACEVDPSPPFQRPMLAVASYSQPPALSDLRLGHFFVPYPPDGVGEAEVQQRLAANCYGTMPTITVHEAYPGHHWHLVVAKDNPRRLRHVFRTSYFVEGWGLYAEELMREQGFFEEPAHEMFQYQTAIFRAARIIVDTGLHMGEMSFEDAVAFMRDRVALPEPTARAEVGRYTAWPTQAASYLTGCLEILRIRERYLTQAGSRDTATLRRFHDTLAASGSLPIALAERVVLAG